MYNLAQRTASYKQRGLSQPQILAEIKATLEDHLIEISLLAAEAKKNSQSAEFYKAVKSVSRSIRRDRRNRIVR